MSIQFPDPTSRSAALFERARRVMPGANTRHMVVFPPYTIYAERGEGCRLWDVDGNMYYDWVNNFSTQIHGYCFPPIVEAVDAQLRRLACCILPSETEVELAELLVERMLAVDQIRFANSGTEAVMVAIKGARGLTGRSRIAKSEGGYHGQFDLVEASFLPVPESWGPAERPVATPFGRGTPQSLLDEALIFPFNDTEKTLALLEAEAGNLTAVIIDPIPPRLGFTPAQGSFLRALRDYCSRTRTVLIFDEVFVNRVGFHGAHGYLDVLPDMIVMGKIIGGGLPVGAVGGSVEAMSVFDNLAGPLRVSHSGTFTANPLTMAAGLACMRALDEAAFAKLAADGEALRSGLNKAIDEAGLEMRAVGVASMTSLQFFRESISNYREFHSRSGSGYLERMKRLHRCLLREGVLMATRGMFIGSTAFGQFEIEDTIARAARAFREFAWNQE